MGEKIDNLFTGCLTIALILVLAGVASWITGSLAPFRVLWVLVVILPLLILYLIS